jgi:hypothetical protein
MPRVRKKVDSTRATPSAIEHAVKAVVTGRPLSDFRATVKTVMQGILRRVPGD